MITKTTSLPVIQGREKLVLKGKVGKHHDKHDGECTEPTCGEKTSHNHWTSEGCLGCIKDYFESLFPLEKKIAGLKVQGEEIGTNAKQFLLMVSNLTPAIAMSEILKPLHVDSFVASPLAISAMHLANRGTDKLHKLGLTSLSSVGLIAMQKFMGLPRLLIRPIMALAVFFIEKNGKEKHVHTKDCKHEDHEHHEHEKEHNNVHKHNEKAEWLKLLKLQGQINTVPSIVNFGIGKLKEMNESNESLLGKFTSHIGISALQILGLSGGFLGVGKLIDNILLKLNFVTADELAMRAEGAVCACCGAPVCVAETASESAAIVSGG